MFCSMKCAMVSHISVFCDSLILLLFTIAVTVVESVFVVTFLFNLTISGSSGVCAECANVQ